MRHNIVKTSDKIRKSMPDADELIVILKRGY